jgi:hypothetical protein
MAEFDVLIRASVTRGWIRFASKNLRMSRIDEDSHASQESVTPTYYCSTATYETVSRMYGLFCQTRKLRSVSEWRREVAFKGYTIGRLAPACPSGGGRRSRPQQGT